MLLTYGSSSAAISERDEAGERCGSAAGEAGRAAVTFADDELLPMQTGRIEPGPAHHRGDDRPIVWPCPPHHHLHPAIITPGRPARAARRPPAGLVRDSVRSFER